jgi:MFS family permease
MLPQVKTFYIFLGLHSFLIGLFPFFIPVYLWKQGGSLPEVSAFIGVTGVGFCITLYCWDRLLDKLDETHLICLSFFIELLLLSTFFLEDKYTFLLLCGVLNGAYNCSFWILQRLLFMNISSPQNSGNRFGNLQIVAFAFLKTAIITGGLFLDTLGFSTLYIFSALITLGCITYFVKQKTFLNLKKSLAIGKPQSLGNLLTYKDNCCSRRIFVCDGVFLFLEAYFWVITLFTIVRESFWKLGILVVLLAVLFGGFFLIIKNSIDRVPRQRIYTIAVFLYSASWLLRGVCSDQLSLAVLLILLSTVSFFTSFFRLAFNKRFFDFAKKGGAPYKYVIIKSYYSQFFLALFFLFSAGCMYIMSLTQTFLPYIYYLAGIFSFMYLFYKESEENGVTNCRTDS